MAYVKQEWKDEVLNGPEQYNITAPGTNINGAEITLSTPITQAGTPVTAERMNHIEKGILDMHNMITSGSFVPTLRGITTPGTPVYTTQIGRYAKIGSLVCISLTLVASSMGGAVGGLIINGLPFPTMQTTAVSLPFWAGNFNIWGGIGVGFGSGSNTGILLRKVGNAENLTAAEIPGTFVLMATFNYLSI